MVDAADAVAPGRRWAETLGRVVRALGQRPLSDATVRRIVERAEGNAFYAEELLAATDSPAGGMPSRLSGDDAGARRRAEAATELVGPARASAAHGEDGTPQGPEGQAWPARAEAEWTRAVSGPDVAAWAKAVAGFAYGDAYERARCRLRHAEALPAAGLREEAAAAARAVREAADRLGAALLRERLDALVNRAWPAKTPAGGERAVTLLTAREQEVLRLLARGRSNRRIGEELFISGKTASVHVSHILAKLGAASRTEAVAVAYRKGLISPESATSD